MATDRSVRSLASLSGASSSRVLNLAAIALAQVENKAHRLNPFFYSPVINGAIILKHRLRADEMDAFVPRRAIATKVIIPFQRNDLRAGGSSFFIGQRFFVDLLRDVGNYGERLDITHDLEVLRLLDTVPSLDPFLLREHLRSNGIEPDPSYFSISSADQQRMFDYSAHEIGRLTALATSGKSASRNASTSKIVSALLSNEVGEKLEPLRATLRLDPEEFVEGIFSWRGFLYYKWSLQEFWPNMIKVLRDIKAIRPSGRADAEQLAFLTSVKQALIMGVKTGSNEVRRVLGVYDDAYAQLIERQDPKQFRDFLLNAPSMFLELGEKIGSMSHITSFWQYRFPTISPKAADVEELMMIFQDFAQSFGLEIMTKAAA